MCSSDLAGLPIPRTAVAWDAASFDKVLAEIRPPLVLKLLDGTWGMGVVKADSPDSARSIFDLLRSDRSELHQGGPECVSSEQLFDGWYGSPIPKLLY